MGHLGVSMQELLRVRRPVHLALLLVALLCTALLFLSPPPAALPAWLTHTALYARPAAFSSSTLYPVCSEQGQHAWAHHFSLHHTAHPSPRLPSSSLRRPPWSALTPPPAAAENPVYWQPPSSLNLSLEEANLTSATICRFLDHHRDRLTNPDFHPSPPHPFHRLPPFPFPSLNHSLAPNLLFSLPAWVVPVPNHNASDPLYVQGGAAVPLDWRGYDEDALMMEAAWPLCFSDLQVDEQRSTDVWELLSQLDSLELNDTQRAELLDPVRLNALGLSLNLRRFPTSQYPLPSVGRSVPLVVTTVDTDQVVLRLPSLAAQLRAMIGVEDSTVLINMETVRASTLRVIAEQFDFARVRFFFLPVARCAVHAPYKGELNKNWRINMAALFMFHAVFNLLHYPYAAVVEDDMTYSRDFYLYHLSVSEHVVRTPHIFAAAATSYSRFYDCYHLTQHLQGHFTPPPLLADGIPHVDPTQAAFAQSDLRAFNFTATQLLVLERTVLPWGAGYSRKLYPFLLNFFLSWQGSLSGQRYDVVLHFVYGSHPTMTTLVPLVPRVHGDPRFYHPTHRRLPLMTACQHSLWEVVAPRKLAHTFTSAHTAHYDSIEHEW